MNKRLDINSKFYEYFKQVIFNKIVPAEAINV